MSAERNIAWIKLFGGCGLVLFLVMGLSAFAPAPEKQYPAQNMEMKPGAQTGQKLQLVGAKNEYLSQDFQVKGADLGTFKVRVQERGTGLTPSFKFYQVRGAGPSAPGQYQADALVPLEQGLISTGPITEVWATIKIPAAMPAGIHSYEIIFQDKQSTYKQPLEIRVWNFSLPDDLPIPILANLTYTQAAFTRYGVKTTAQYEEALRAYLRSMRDYKINSLGFFYPFPAKSLQAGKRVEDFPGFDRMLRYAVNELHYRFFRVPLLPGAQTIDHPGSEFARLAPIYYPLFQDYLRRHNLEKRALIKIWDEPKPESFQALYNSYALVKKAAPGIRTESAGNEPDPRLAKVIDIWVSFAPEYNPEKIAAARSLGQEIWLYANKLHGIDQPLAHHRLIGWMIHNYGYQGYLFWSVNYWPQDPWTTPISGKGGVSLRRGAFFYPDTRTGLPIPTTRLEAVRRGFQDYLYLSLLDQAHQQGRLESGTFEGIKRQEQIVCQGIKLLRRSPPPGTMQDLEKIRLQVGEILNRVK